MLTDKQKLFCEEYVNCHNASEAYERAGYASSKRNISGVEGHKLLKNPKILAYINELEQKRSQRTQITGDRLLEELARIAFSNIVNFSSFTDSGVKVKDSSTLPDSVTGAIAEVTSETQETIAGKHTFVNTKVKVKLFDKMRAIELAMKYLGMTSDFNCAIATFRKYGLALKQEGDGWIVEDISKERVVTE